MQIGAICHMELMVKVLSPSYVNTYPSGTVYNKTKQTKTLPIARAGAKGEGYIYVLYLDITGPYFQKVLEISKYPQIQKGFILESTYLSTENYRDMGHGMGQRVFAKISSNF